MTGNPEDKGRRLPEIKPVERRTFLRYALVGGTATGLATFGVASLGFLWPSLGGGFGADINVGPAADILAGIKSERAPLEFPAGRMYVVAVSNTLPGFDDTYGEIAPTVSGTDALMALYQKCVHLGCRVPWCQTSQWFECPCHGSKYNKIGEWTGGPAPRGLDRFSSTIDGDGNLIVSTGTIITGPPRTGRILEQEAEGPNCVSL